MAARSLVSSVFKNKSRLSRDCLVPCKTRGDGTSSHLFGGEERLVADAGDDDGVHVHLLPQVLVVGQVQGLVVQLLAPTGRDRGRVRETQQQLSTLQTPY